MLLLASVISLSILSSNSLIFVGSSPFLIAWFNRDMSLETLSNWLTTEFVLRVRLFDLTARFAESLDKLYAFVYKFNALFVRSDESLYNCLSWLLMFEVSLSSLSISSASLDEFAPLLMASLSLV